MGLTDEEKATLKRLNDKAKEPDSSPIGKSVNVIVDLKDKAQVALARSMGFLPGGDDDEAGSDDAEGD